MKIVLSGVNLVEGGTLRVFKDAILAFSKNNDIELICLVHRQALFSDVTAHNVSFLEFPSIKSSWLKRCWFEYFHCKNLSKNLNADIWFAMHDMTPNVTAKKRFVYCHNPSPFYTAVKVDYRFEYKMVLFSFFYKWLYQLNIKKNDAVVCQQSWIAEYFKTELGAKKAIIAKPVSKKTQITSTENTTQLVATNKKVTFFYPALARTFKNFELVLDAFLHLKTNAPDCYNKVELVLTIDKGSNQYAQHLVKKYHTLENVTFLGQQPYDEILKLYNRTEVVIFPSKLETWGLPISEAKEHGKPLILVDLPYAHETLGNYDKAHFVDADDPIALAKSITQICNGTDIFSAHQHKQHGTVVENWTQLLSIITQD
ncbi:glycosyltransferase [Motilimonas pumila]|uniref:Glycosyltransferase family 1 protein n=1 Tax=Motilimonas pumila TaxID=2303987 RepID=A0A418YDW8_9GAMM|nr:glycosyltransferase [Motilimonas pumila]RJG42740.1 glycosyltransferase family 1 protein [Motilimonas pumila]